MSRRLTGCKERTPQQLEDLADLFPRLPGLPPTGRSAEIPFAAVVNIRGDRLYHEHISWDQGTALTQLGLLPEYLPFPGGELEYRVPVAGLETAMKLRSRHSVQSNEMFNFKTRSRKDSEQS